MCFPMHLRASKPFENKCNMVQPQPKVLREAELRAEDVQPARLRDWGADERRSGAQGHCVGSQHGHRRLKSAQNWSFRSG